MSVYLFAQKRKSNPRFRKEEAGVQLFFSKEFTLGDHFYVPLHLIHLDYISVPLDPDGSVPALRSCVFLNRFKDLPSILPPPIFSGRPPQKIERLHRLSVTIRGFSVVKYLSTNLWSKLERAVSHPIIQPNMFVVLCIRLGRSNDHGLFPLKSRYRATSAMP